MPIRIAIIIHNIRNPNYKQGEKSIQMGKEEVKLSLFLNDMVLFIENSNNSLKKRCLESISKFSRVAG